MEPLFNKICEETNAYATRQLNNPLEYQKGMGGVDLLDQVTALFPIMRRTVKGCRKIFFYLLDMLTPLFSNPPLLSRLSRNGAIPATPVSTLG
jgi:hypothetical protein